MPLISYFYAIRATLPITEPQIMVMAKDGCRIFVKADLGFRWCPRVSIVADQENSITEVQGFRWCGCFQDSGSGGYIYESVYGISMMSKEKFLFQRIRGIRLYWFRVFDMGSVFRIADQGICGSGSRITMMSELRTMVYIPADQGFDYFGQGMAWSNTINACHYSGSGSILVADVLLGKSHAG